MLAGQSRLLRPHGEYTGEVALKLSRNGLREFAPRELVESIGRKCSD